ncbi:MAG: hypothetical protein COB09_19155 [Thalassobium sp.]|nr:MAG: hypothetical protein COB09_19155 [Thalassobium sp.]
MTQFTITGKDTLTLYDRVFANLADDDTSTITFPEDLVSVSTGKNQNTIFALNEKGNNGVLVLRVMRGSSDDQFLVGKQAITDKDFVSTVLANGEFRKRLGDGDGGVIADVYTLQGGMITRRVEGKENVSGDTEQGVAVYTFTFALARRSIQ